MKVSMESPEVKSGNAGQPRATREIPPLYIFSQAGTCPGVPGRNLRGTSTSSSREQRTRATPFAPGRHSFAPRGCSYSGLAPVGAPPSVRTWASTFSHPTRVLLPRFHSCRSTALGANRASTYSHPGRVLLPRPGSCRSTALGANGASTYSHPTRVLLPRFRSCRSTALGANRGKHVVRTQRVLLRRSPHPLHSAGDDAADATYHQPAHMGGVGDSTETQYADDPRQTEHQPGEHHDHHALGQVEVHVRRQQLVQPAI